MKKSRAEINPLPAGVTGGQISKLTLDSEIDSLVNSYQHQRLECSHSGWREESSLQHAF